MSLQGCQRCLRPLPSGWGFAFKSGPLAPSSSNAPSAQNLHCLRCALQHPPLLRRSLIAALVVGTIITLLNQGDTLLLGRWNNTLYWKIPLSYCVPFLVAMYGALSNSRK